MADLQGFQPGSSDWDVFDGEGRYLGIVEMPDGFTPARVLDEAIVGIYRDELGLQRILKLRLIRPELAGD